MKVYNATHHNNNAVARVKLNIAHVAGISSKAFTPFVAALT